MQKNKAPIEKLPPELTSKISEYLAVEERVTLVKSSPRLFKHVWSAEWLLSAVFMGDESTAVKIVRANPDLLFERGTYRMPLLNEKGTQSTQSEQIYHDVTPLQLALYTGDWKMWDCLFPLLPIALIDKALEEIRLIARGGPDLVKTNRDPSLSSLAELTSFRETNQATDGAGNPILYPLLGNPDGIFYVETNHQVQFYYVKVNPDTQEIRGCRLDEPDNLSPEDQLAFNQLKNAIQVDMPSNSSRRTSDAEHALIERVFGIRLERNGIHYELNGLHYRDTYDGCTRLMNAYRRYFELHALHQPETVWHAVDAAWMLVAQAQRQAMACLIQRFCEIGQVLHFLDSNAELKQRPLVRTDECMNSRDNQEKWHVYPLWFASGIGFDFALYNCFGECRRIDALYARDLAINYTSNPLERQLLAIRQISEVSKACLNELAQALEQKLHPSPGLGGCTVS